MAVIPVAAVAATLETTASSAGQAWQPAPVECGTAWGVGTTPPAGTEGTPPPAVGAGNPPAGPGMAGLGTATGVRGAGGAGASGTNGVGGLGGIGATNGAGAGTGGSGAGGGNPGVKGGALPVPDPAGFPDSLPAAEPTPPLMSSPTPLTVAACRNMKSRM